MTKKLGTIIIFRGIPGCGKTTKAEKMQDEMGGRIVGRDHFRKLLGITKGVGTPKQEEEITALQTRMIVQGLRSGEIVYVDDMNLKSSYVSRLIGIAQKYNAGWRVEDMTFVELDECIQHNANRKRKVPVSVIEDLHYRYVKGNGYPLRVPTGKLKDPYLPPDKYIPDPSKPKAILVDIDGTVADHTRVRGHHEYHKVSLDVPKPEVIMTVLAFIENGYTPIFMSGRPESCALDTRIWLNKYVTTDGALIMRATGDRRADYIIKNELFDKHVRNNFNVLVAIDDRQQVVDMYREMGLTVLQVDEGAF